MGKIQPSLHVFVSGFGSPHLEEKLRILSNNIANIEKYNWSHIHYTICCYDSSDLTTIEILANINTNANPTTKTTTMIVRDPLIVAQFLKKYLVPNTDSTNYTYLLCILDDIELNDNIDWEYMIHYIKMFDIDLLSPSMTRCSKYQFQYMLQDSTFPNSAIKITSALEYFCYFTTPKSYAKYYEHLNGERNPWMWGLDMLLYKHVGLKLGIVNHMTMKHWYKNENYSIRTDANPCDGYNYVLEKYKETTDGLANQPSLLYIILQIGMSKEILKNESSV
jgi:hypothetical protein